MEENFFNLKVCFNSDKYHTPTAVNENSILCQYQVPSIFGNWKCCSTSRNFDRNPCRQCEVEIYEGPTESGQVMTAVTNRLQSADIVHEAHLSRCTTVVSRNASGPVHVHASLTSFTIKWRSPHRVPVTESQFHPLPSQMIDGHYFATF